METGGETLSLDLHFSPERTGAIESAVASGLVSLPEVPGELHGNATLPASVGLAALLLAFEIGPIVPDCNSGCGEVRR